MASSQAVLDQAFVTLATNDTYALGALVLAHSLRNVGTTRRLAVMITGDVTQGVRQQLDNVFDVVTCVDVLDSQDTANLALLTRPDLGVTFTKFHCWRLTQFTKCVFMDADTLVLQNIDELFEREELSAAPDVGWPDCFNSGVFVFRPSEETYTSLLAFAVSQGSFDGGDQGLLNMYFSDWATKDIAKHLPFIYNVVSQAFYSYLPSFRQFGKNIKVVHFIGESKPWHHVYNTATGHVEVSGDAGHKADFLQIWWNLFMEKVQPFLDPGLSVTIGGMQASRVCVVHYVPRPPPIWQQSVPAPPSGSLNNYQMTSPYQPPHVPVFYQTTPERVVSEPQPIVNKDDRPFGFFESFYSEPPMTHSELYPTPTEVYEAKEFEQSWTEFAQPKPEETGSGDSGSIPLEHNKPMHESDQTKLHETGSNQSKPHDTDSNQSKPHETGSDQSKPHETGSDKSKPQKTVSEHSKDQKTASHMIKPYKPGVSPTNIESLMHEVSPLNPQWHAHGVKIESVENKLNKSGPKIEPNLTSKPKKDKSGSQHDHITNGTKVGLVGHLASMKVSSGYSPQQLSDRQRQFAWERGHIDYKGIDSFEHIQAHLDTVIKKDESPPAASQEVKKPATVVTTATVKPAPVTPAQVTSPKVVTKTEVTLMPAQPTPAAQPAAVKPPAAQQPVAAKPPAAQQPAAAKPPAPQQPAAAKPPAQKSVAAKPPAAQQPATAKPQAAQQPAAAKPPAQKPAAAKPPAQKPAAAKPQAAQQPAAAKPPAQKPAAAKPQVAKPPPPGQQPKK